MTTALAVYNPAFESQLMLREMARSRMQKFSPDTVRVLRNTARRLAQREIKRDFLRATSLEHWCSASIRRAHERQEEVRTMNW